MSQMKFYKKFGPSTKPVLSNNQAVAFETSDNLVGYFATDNAFIQAEFERFISGQRYGITPIDEAEYTAFQEKKTQSPTLGQPWREELGKGHRQGKPLFEQVGAEAVAAAVAVEGCDNQRRPCGQAMADAPLSVPVAVAEGVAVKTAEKKFIPTTGRRKKSPLY